MLLDDVRLPAARFSLDRLLQVARHNNLSTVSPAVLNAHDAIMAPTSAGRPADAVGRVVRRLEIFAVALTAAGYRCWFELIDVGLNAVGWGYDHWLHPFCRTWRSFEYKAGIVDTQVAVHGAQANASGSRATAFEHTYARKGAREARDAMQRNFRQRGIHALHLVDRATHGWLADVIV